MPIDLANIPEPLKEAARTRSLVPLIGAGVSRQAKTPSTDAFPTWTNLILELERIAVRQKCITVEEQAEIAKLARQGKYLMAAEELKERLYADERDDFLLRRFKPRGAEPGLIHLQLFKLHPPLILTTNYDTLLEVAYYQVFNVDPGALTFKQAHLVEKFLKTYGQSVQPPLIFKIHGSATNPEEAIFAESDYRQLRYREPGYRIVLSAIFVTKVVLMLGFSFSDPEISVLTETLRESLDHRSGPDYIVLPKGEKGEIEKKRMRQDFGLHVIEYEPSGNHRELLDLVDYLVALVPPCGDSATAP